MSNVQIISRSTSHDTVSEGAVRSQIGTPDGVAYSADYILSKTLEGRVFHANVGDLTTPVTFRVAADADQPESVIDVPTGTLIVPINIQVHLEDSAGTNNEIIALANPALVGAGTSTVGTILSARVGSNRTSACKHYFTYSGNGTAPSGYVQFWHTGVAFADVATDPTRVYEWSITKDAPVAIVGPGSLVLHIDGTGTAPAGFHHIAWMEFDANTF